MRSSFSQHDAASREVCAHDLRYKALLAAVRTAWTTLADWHLAVVCVAAELAQALAPTRRASRMERVLSSALGAKLKLVGDHGGAIVQGAEVIEDNSGVAGWGSKDADRHGRHQDGQGVDELHLDGLLEAEGCLMVVECSEVWCS